LANKESKSAPTPTQKEIPQWYKDADRFAKNPINGEYYKAPKRFVHFQNLELQMIME
jgi:hypothetical protein